MASPVAQSKLKGLHSRSQSSIDIAKQTQRLSHLVGVDESLRTYKLLEALRSGDETAIDRHLAESSHANDSSDPSNGLILAVQCADAATIKYILSKNTVDVNARDLHGNTALHIAAQLGRADVIDILMKSPDINDTIKNGSQKQAFELVKNPDIAHHMQQNRGAYIESINLQFLQAMQSRDSSPLAELLDNPRTGALLDLNRTDPSNGNTPLHDTVSVKDISKINLLLNHGADPFRRNKKGKQPLDYTRDDQIRSLFKNVPQKTLLSSAPGEAISYSGHLKKWTNYKSGYKSRWFVLEHGVLSYYKNPDDKESACRGSINMRVAKVHYVNGDKTKFEILGPGFAGFHLKASHPTEAKNWVWNLQQAIQKARDSVKAQTSRDLTSGMVMDDAVSVSASLRTISSDTRAESIVTPIEMIVPACYSRVSFSDDESVTGENDNNPSEQPHRDTWGVTAHSAKVQLEIMDQLCESIHQESKASKVILDARMQVAIESFKSSVTSLRGVLTQLMSMAGDRERYFIAAIEREQDMRRLWEDNMHALAQDQDDMERKVYEANVERRTTKKALKEARTQLSQHASTPTLVKATDNYIGVDASTLVSDTDSDDDEFFDAVGGIGSASIPTTLNTTQAEVAAPISGIYQAPLQTIPGSSRGSYDPSEASNGTSASTPVSSCAAFVSNIESQSGKQHSKSVSSSSATAISAASSAPNKRSDAIVQHSLKAGSDDPASSTSDGIELSFHGYENPIRTSLGRIDDRPTISLWGILKSMIGKDMTKMTLPVSFNEATSLLQRVAEDMEYAEILDKAASLEDPSERALYVAAFAASEYSSTIDRIAKPFNPLLHETYEYCRPDKGYRFLVEQVSHHPPIGAAYADSCHWEYYGESSVKSKFYGKSFDINPLGTWYLKLKLPGGIEEMYSWKKVTTSVVGIITGSPTVDNYGEMLITNHTTGEKCKLDFQARGWRGAGAYKVDGTVHDPSGNPRWTISGKWNEKIYAKPAGSKAGNAFLVWAVNPRPAAPFNLTQFALSLNALPQSLKLWLPPTDTRLRPDQRAMEEGKYDLAAEEKNRLEEKQRATRRQREQRGEHGEPRWFKQATHPVTKEDYWAFNGEYWKVREEAHRNNGSWPGVHTIF